MLSYMIIFTVLTIKHLCDSSPEWNCSDSISLIYDYFSVISHLARKGTTGRLAAPNILAYVCKSFYALKFKFERSY